MKPKTICLGTVFLLSSWIPAPAQDEEPHALTPDVLMTEQWQPEERGVGGKPIFLSEEGIESLVDIAFARALYEMAYRSSKCDQI